ncbi:c-type cytochrome [Aestuariirhabdus litorea]|uniref:Cytochrome c5 family protein n=1 Tax=Aestuariirhabdus litorea TaxID=2528527 RepID=A0A3P3VKV3_9GAMM|nr:c-type cytochrome [Aestuariirhabdus litorea]RRJ82399.1 cytochrome c5 family protein [Aestuariirhabdus litorea]RWW92562.1 cytochrome c5 family protein [Endozoicomonadaceae bacterium GTF-13]
MTRHPFVPLLLLLSFFTLSGVAQASPGAIAERLKPYGTLCLKGDPCEQQVVATTPAAEPDRYRYAQTGSLTERLRPYGRVCLKGDPCDPSAAAPVPEHHEVSREAVAGEPQVTVTVTVTTRPASSPETSQPPPTAKPATPPRQETGIRVSSAERKRGQQIVSSSCYGCHDTGVMGAPRIGQKADWAPRARKGVDALLAQAKKGFEGRMPPRGMCSDCSDADLRAAIRYMLSESL